MYKSHRAVEHSQEARKRWEERNAQTQTAPPQETANTGNTGPPPPLADDTLQGGHFHEDGTGHAEPHKQQPGTANP